MADHRRHRGEDGQAIAELVIVAPVLLLVIVLMVALGRVDSAQGDVTSAARAAVQAAAVQADPADAQTQATQAAQHTLAGAGLTCPSAQISVDTSAFTPGGSVAVTVTGRAQAIIPWLDLTVSATSQSPVQEYRTSG